MSEYLIQSETLDAIADAINAKTGGSSAMTPAQMVTAIGSISGGGGGLELLVDDVATEDVAVINAIIPSDKQNMKAYLVGVYGTTSDSEWLYPHLNESQPSTNTGFYFDKTSSYNMVVVVGRAGKGNGGYVWPLNATSNTRVLYTSGSSLTNILFNLYNASSRFKTGFNVKVWGVPSP